jgi:release factor glutamine methyltransferase
LFVRSAPLTVGAALALAEESLAAAGVDSPAAESYRLLGHVLGLGRTELLLRRADALTDSQRFEFLSLLARRSRREPLQLVLGEAPFLDLTLAVAPGVLLPRPETERLVELVLEELDASPPGPGDVLLDVGTGTGAVALALKHAYPQAEVWATDVSDTALELTGRNARALGLPLVLRRSDLLDDPEVAAAAGRAVALVSNPPYLPESDRDVVPPEVAAEPPQALYAGEDGLAVARRLVARSEALLRPGALLALELDPRNVQAMAAELTGFASRRVEGDLAGRERFLLARR